MSEAVESPKPSRAVGSAKAETGHAVAPQMREKAEISTLTILTTLVMLLVFAGLVWVVFLQRKAIPTGTEQTREDRLKTLAQLNADNQKALTTYHWVDKAKGVVGIPIDRAMELVLKDLSANHPHAAGPVNPPTTSPTPAANNPASTNPSPAATPAPSATPESSPASSQEPTANPSPSPSPAG